MKHERWLDRLIVLWIMPPLGFLITVLKVPRLQYLRANYVLIALLLFAVLLLWGSRRFSRRSALHLVFAGGLAIAILGIEWIHFMAGRNTIDGLTDIRMLVYSPLYGSIVIFTLYGIYLTLLKTDQRIQHLRFFVNLMCWFHVFFLFYWVLLYFGWIAPIPKADLLDSNSVSYAALFIICLLLLYRRKIGIPYNFFLTFLLVNLTVIFVNQTRGAVIALIAVAFGLAAMARKSRKRTTLNWTALASAFGLGLVLFFLGGGLSKVLGNDVGSFGIVMEKVLRTYENNEGHVAISSDVLSDESSISAFSRIGTDYYSILTILDHPVLGSGQADSYSIYVLGAGIHSFFFLLVNSTGFLGLLLFVSSLIALVAAQRTIALDYRLILVFVLFFGYVLIFLNDIPPYYALIPTIIICEMSIRSVGSEVIASQKNGLEI